jgi:PAS domain S-box-containing protein
MKLGDRERSETAQLDELAQLDTEPPAQPGRPSGRVPSTAVPSTVPESDTLAISARALHVDSDLGVDLGQWLTGILAHSTDVISILDLQGRLLYINQTKPSTTVDKVVGRRAVDFLPPPSAQLWNEAFLRAVQTVEAQQFEVQSHGDYWWETRLVPIRSGEQVISVISIGSDISARKRAESELAAKEELLGMALSAARMGQWAWNIATDRLVWDATTNCMLAWQDARDEATLEALVAAVHPEDRELLRSNFDRARQAAVSPALEFRILLANGAERWVHLTGKVQLGDDGNPSDVLGGVLDVTHQRQSERALHRAQKLEALGQLAAGVAHDFNNLLVAIMGSVQLAQVAKTPSEQKELLNDAVSACLSAGDLTRRLLAFGRAQAVKEQAVDLSELLTETLHLLQRLIPPGITVEVNVTAGLPPVLGDRGQFEQVVMNLCLNARDAMPSGGLLRISAMPVPLGSQPPSSGRELRFGHYVCLTVEDTGSGIPPERVSRIFEPFFTTKEQGTGLGLATVYNIVKQHGGTIDLASEPGRGSTFKVYLPTA